MTVLYCAGGGGAGKKVTCHISFIFGNTDT